MIASRSPEHLVKSLNSYVVFTMKQTQRLVLLIAGLALVTTSFSLTAPTYAQNQTLTGIPIIPIIPTNNATTTTTGVQIITNMTWYEDINNNPLLPGTGRPPDYQNRTEPLSEQNIQYQQSDPTFAKLAQTTYDCLTHYNEITKKTVQDPNYKSELYEGGAGAADFNRQDLCTDAISQGITYFCDALDFATYDMMKCQEARAMSEEYLGVAETIYG